MIVATSAHGAMMVVVVSSLCSIVRPRSVLHLTAAMMKHTSRRFFILSPPTDLQQPVERLPHLLPLPGHCTFEPLDAVPIDVLEDRRFAELPTGLRSGDQCVGLDLPPAEPGTVPVGKPEVGNALNGNSGT